MTECIRCSIEATHILVNYNHSILGDGEVYCSDHAFKDGREECPCCDDYWIEFDGEEFLPTYPAGTLDGEGCCSDHP
ncbi:MULTISPECIES: hypothetical protein [unclassified Halomonas]|uniref:hypothetical protein n=1 Tax=unclassified Halomonas TaxID=2609666 RepID=UPI0005FCCAE0|nr:MULTISPECIES: hypothetical protein [unclassified Halomonas]CEP34354.1 Putative uncharacterized protein [Halomonas sp. R57-5]